MNLSNVQAFIGLILGSAGLGGLIGAWFTYKNNKEETSVKWHQRAGEEVLRLYDRVAALEDENRELRHENLDQKRRIDQLENRLRMIEEQKAVRRMYGPHDVRGGDTE